ncbi:MAG: hypothetical protein ACD_75C01418G0001 [uncultured bacterium]|nr:MAG: hypothetical protein ACD_75C01418G0001 [uncultured bacterium]
MNQSVHAGAGGQVRVHGDSGEGIDQGNVGNHRLADDGDLFFVCGIGNDGELGNVGGGSGGCRNADEGRTGNGDVVDSFKTEDVLAIGADDADALGAVHRAAAAERNDHIAMLFVVELRPRHDLGITRVGRNGGEDGGFYAFFVMETGEFGKPAGVDNALVGNNKGLLRAEVAEVAADELHGFRPENELRGDKFS